MKGRIVAVVTVVALLALSACGGFPGAPEGVKSSATPASSSTSSSVASQSASSQAGETEADFDFGQEESALEDYTWDELSTISAEIAAANSEADALEIAKDHGLVNADGQLDGTQVKTVELENGLSAEVQIAGFAHDEKADGGMAGITFVFKDCIAEHPMNASDTNSGGWKSSDMRSWLASDGMQLLPAELRDVIVPVVKQTNNDGSGAKALVTETEDRLWLPSAKELFGEIAWYDEDDGTGASFNDVYNQEGVQYQLYRDTEADQNAANRILVKPYLPAEHSLNHYMQGFPCFWWLRSPGPNHDDTFRRVDTLGYPLYNDYASLPDGVAPGFCI